MISYGGEWTFDGDELGGYPAKRGHAVYETVTGKLLHHVCSGLLKGLDWSPCSRYLYVQGDEHDDNISKAGIEVFDTLSGHMVQPP